MLDTCTDRLTALLDHFPVRAQMFHSGTVRGIEDLAAPAEEGQMHLVRSGVLQILQPERPALSIGVPSLLFYPRPTIHRFVADGRDGAELASASLHFEGGLANPIVSALPDVVCLPLDRIEGAGPVLAQLFGEAFGTNCGRLPLINRLFEVVLIQLLRHLMEAGLVRGGMLGGLSHPRLRKALVAMHGRPAHDWSLPMLAELAGMSRSVFATTFRTEVGCTAGTYLQGWRIRLAQQSLRQGRALKAVAAEIGYGSEAALSRAFKAQCGMGPRAWRQSLDLAAA